MTLTLAILKPVVMSINTPTCPSKNVSDSLALLFISTTSPRVNVTTVAAGGSAGAAAGGGGSAGAALRLLSGISL